MLTRQGIAPLEHLSTRLGDVKRISKLTGNWFNAQSSMHRRRTSSFKRYKMPWKVLSKGSKMNNKPLLRKSHKRTLHNVLPVSHTFMAKRMRMDDNSWFAVKTAKHNRARGLESCLELAQRACVLQDISHEVWFSISSTSDDVLSNQVLQRMFDPSLVDFETNMCGTDLIIYSLDSFPSEPLGPVRLWRVSQTEMRFAVHVFCAEAIWQSLLGVQSNLVRVEKLPMLSTYLLIGKQAEQVCDFAFEKVLAVIPTQTELCCPLTNKRFASEEDFAKYFFHKQFGTQLQHDLISLEPVPPVSSISKLSPHVNKFSFEMGRKITTKLPACLLVVDETLAKQIFLVLAKRVSACIGQDEFAYMCLYMHLPSFPRDFPDTPAHSAFWSKFAEKQSLTWYARPKSKRGSHLEPIWTPHYVEDEEDELTVVRGWHYVKDFVQCSEELPPPGTLLRVFLLAPRSNRFGPRFAALDSIYLATEDDYAKFTSKTKFQITGERTKIGCLSSSRCVSTECFGIGHVTVQGYCELQSLAQQRKNKNRSLLVLVRKPTAGGDDYYGAALLTLF